MSEFVMPKLGADMTAGTLVAWRKQPGQAVARGDIIAEVDTDKGIIDVEVFADGVLERCLVQPGERVPIGTVMALIADAGAPPVAAPALATSPARGSVPHSVRQRISPAARRRAEELGVDAGALAGTGPSGAVTCEDVERAAGDRPASAGPGTVPAGLSAAQRMRQAIAAAMSRANREIPHYYLATTLDLEPLLTWLTKENERRPVAQRLVYGAALLKAVALTLRQFPDLNGFWEHDHLVPSEHVHLGVAISLRQGGLVAPALHDADQLSLDELMARLRELVERTRAGALRSSELADPTVTVSNLGEQGVEAVFGVIYPPQVALVGFGKVQRRPWVVGDQVGVRSVLTATLAGDHRASDGHRGGRFLTALARSLQEPDKL
jgi:pyruvate dehydrogenase E2 component (dihydrolipoamide acetyltransferase)